MSNSLLPKTAAALLVATVLTSLVSAQTTYNAFNDFYLSPTAIGWGGATNPSTAGSTWGYYMGNVNANGFPSTVGTYLTSGQIYKYSTVGPLSSDPTVYSVSGWADTGGQGFPNYVDNVAWGAPGGLHSSLGSYSTPWFGGAPGLSQNLTNLIWMQSVWLGSGAAEGIASMLTWRAPQAGVYTFSGLFVSGDQSENSASVAIVDSRGATNLARTVLDNNGTHSIAFTASYAVGDVVQFQVGNNFTGGNAVGLQLNIVRAPSTNVIVSLQTTTNLANGWQNLPVSPAMITPEGKLNLGSITNSNTFYRLGAPSFTTNQ